MDCVIVYFSLTKNTKKIAHAIHNAVAPLVARCDLKALKLVDTTKLDNYDLIGLGSPVWAAVPANVERFIQSLPVLEEKHAFVFSTHGTKPERFFPRIVELLQNKGLTVIGTRDWYGSVYLPNLPKPYFTDGHPDAIDLKEAEDFGREMVQLSTKIKSGEAEPPPLPEPLPPEAYGSARPRIKKTFHEKKCRFPECRLCMDHCPMDAIDLSLFPKIFKKGCEYCYFCEMICPEGAIEVDYGSVLEMGVSRAKDVFLKALEKAEAEGRFRPLIAKEDIGWETPYYKLHNKHPRYIIPKDEK
ncbi:MAG: EFR1 family ferrodoxin [Deltaproteobacteria bacterium]|nr:EFR1 family ferrodoxin [Deltaproteobacteria bacterium]